MSLLARALRPLCVFVSLAGVCKAFYDAGQAQKEGQTEEWLLRQCDERGFDLYPSWCRLNGKPVPSGWTWTLERETRSQGRAAAP